jgi:ketosteroid isomerase-like protein
MKTVLAVLLLVLPAFAGDSSKAEKEVIATLETWKQAFLKNDAATLNKLYHSDLAYTHSSAKVQNKNEAIEALNTPSGSAKVIEYSHLTTHVYGSTAIVKGLFDITNGNNALSHLDVLMVWLRSPQGWQLVARQAVRLPEAAPAAPAK